MSSFGNVMSGGQFGGLSTPNMSQMTGSIGGSAGGGMNLNSLSGMGSFGSMVTSKDKPKTAANKHISNFGRFNAQAYFSSLVSGLPYASLELPQMPASTTSATAGDGRSAATQLDPASGDLSLERYQKLAEVVVKSHGPRANLLWSIDPSRALGAVMAGHPGISEQMTSYLQAEQKYLQTRSPEDKKAMAGSLAQIVLSSTDPAKAMTVEKPEDALALLQSNYGRQYRRMMRYLELQVVRGTPDKVDTQAPGAPTLSLGE